MLKLKEIQIKNFKSLKDCKLELRNFNVLVGANASGKTNLVDLFLLLRKIYVEKDINPFRYWWGYQNAVWNRKEELDISVRFVFEYIDDKGKAYDISFETTFTGRGGRFEILREKLEIKGLISLELTGNILNLAIGENKKLRTVLTNDTTTLSLLNLKFIISYKTKILDELLFQPSLSIEMGDRYFMIDTIDSDKVETFVNITKFVSSIIESIKNFFLRTILLKLNINEIKRPSPLKREYWLLENGGNLNSVLYTLYLKENRIPDRIATLISYLFPNINIGFSITEDQRVYLKVQENGLELPPVCIADGLYKLLAILTALELNPSLLIIDEVENSLHPETLEKLLDELKSSETTVIITTHSPVVVDMIEPEDLVIVEKIAGETKFRRIENPEEIKKKLREAGITFSEGWLYGQI